MCGRKANSRSRECACFTEMENTIQTKNNMKTKKLIYSKCSNDNYRQLQYRLHISDTLNLALFEILLACHEHIKPTAEALILATRSSGDAISLSYTTLFSCTQRKNRSRTNREIFEAKRLAPSG